MKSTLLLLATAALLGTTACSHKQLNNEPTTEHAALTSEAPKQELHTVVKPTENKDKLALACLVKKDKRLIEIDKKAKRCEVFYTKEGHRNQVAWAESTQSVCENIFQSIKANIEKGGFKCTSDLKEFDKEERKTASN